ncbi:MAG: adenosine deaminase [Anaerolineales bacterium]
MDTIDPNLPLIDLHRHLDGSIRMETILDLGRKNNLELPAWDIEGLRPYVQITNPQPGVMAFIEKFEWMVGVLVNYEDCQRVAYENVLDAQNEGLDYVELRFSPWFMSVPHELKPEGVVEAVVEGVNQARNEIGMMVNLLGIISRTYGPETAKKELNALIAFRDNFVGIDLAGDEANFPGELFVDHMKTAREAGLRVTVHAGESSGSDSIWQAIRELGAERIGHAVRAIDDVELMHFMAENRIGVEANLTSNVQTSTVPDYASHPLREFLESGILATINTDDPGISGIDLIYEYEHAAPAAGLTKEQIHQAQRNALEIAFLSEVEKKVLLDNRSQDLER